VFSSSPVLIGLAYIIAGIPMDFVVLAYEDGDFYIFDANMNTYAASYTKIENIGTSGSTPAKSMFTTYQTY
jgi:hypothetical protein